MASCQNPASRHVTAKPFDVSILTLSWPELKLILKGIA
jgi:hypothetical protein